MIVDKFFSYIFPPVFIFFWCYFLATIIKWVLNRKKEEKSYETMMLNPNDTTVSAYVQNFLKASKAPFIIRANPAHHAAKNLEDKARQAQGYQTIIENPNVSDQAKEQLKRAFLSKGVPIQ